MTQELGQIQRPAAAQYIGKRTLLLVPLVYGPRAEAPEGQAILEKFWGQARSQILSLESRLGEVQHIYHESLTEGGLQGLKHLEALDQRCYHLVQSKCKSGATLEPTEDPELLAEALDLQRCLMLPYASAKVARRLREWFSESARSRYEHIARRIDATLKENEMGLLLISEQHQVQFPADLEVFYVSPPALDEFRRWWQSWLARQQQTQGQEPEDGGEPEGDEQTQGAEHP